MTFNGNFFLKCKRLAQNQAPVDTGNLKFNSFKLEKKGKNEATIYIEKQIAPYMPYTNEIWVSPRWGGKKNPNQDWWDKAFDSIVNYLTHDLHGEIQKNSYKEYKK